MLLDVVNEVKKEAPEDVPNWNAKLAEAKVLQEKNAAMDKKPGRFFEDQPDVNDDYQIHFNLSLIHI